MKGELLPVWPRTWDEIWLRLAAQDNVPDDLFMELVGGLASPPRQPIAPVTPPAGAYDVDGKLRDAAAIDARREYDLAMSQYLEDRRAYEAALNSEDDAREYFRGLLRGIGTELEAVKFIENSYETLTIYDDVNLTHNFRQLVSEFLTEFSLRYEIRNGLSLHATLSGLFSKLITELRAIAHGDPHLGGLLSDFEEAFADLKMNRSQARMKTCLQKQFNMLEGFGQKCPKVTAKSLGAICDQLEWPHEKVKEVGKNLYKFGSDYPGVRHGGTASGALRDLEVRDFVSLSLMLASFTPYVIHNLDPDRCYSG